jgi:hypothetical protein
MSTNVDYENVVVKQNKVIRNLIQQLQQKTVLLQQAQSDLIFTRKLLKISNNVSEIMEKY